MAIVIGILLAISFGVCIWLFQSRRHPAGLVPYPSSEQQERILVEHALKFLLEAEQDGNIASTEQLERRLGLSAGAGKQLEEALAERGLLDRAGGSGEPVLRLTPNGRDYARHVIRTHRLWEKYLADHTGLDESEWHIRADSLEHELTPEQTDRLAARLGHPTHDPHGDPVPSLLWKETASKGRPLESLEPGQGARILHIEDEPTHVFRRIAAKCLAPGMTVRLISRSEEGCLIETEGRREHLSREEAANVTVGDPLPKDQVSTGMVPLSCLAPGRKAVVRIVSRALRAPERRRFLDLGLVPGTQVTVELPAPSGDPVAYRIRGTLVALRRDQAAHVLVELLPEAA
ncbi:MAG TPA: metal-dependent transcriptional regulator [Acidobacteriota bacterium]|nr:metal-dependent transcriptional regulator [Acidobacteriota bacterium]